MASIEQMVHYAFRDLAAVAELRRIQTAAKAAHYLVYKARRAQGKDYPLLPYECSAAYEHAFERTWPQSALTYRAPKPARQPMPGLPDMNGFYIP